MPCSVIGCPQCREVSGHHLKTKGAGGDDQDWNLLPLCQLHHIEIHQLGLKLFIKKYPNIKDIIIDKGWEFNSSEAKWMYYNGR